MLKVKCVRDYNSQENLIGMRCILQSNQKGIFVCFMSRNVLQIFDRNYWLIDRGVIVKFLLAHVDFIIEQFFISDTRNAQFLCLIRNMTEPMLLNNMLLAKMLPQKHKKIIHHMEKRRLHPHPWWRRQPIINLRNSVRIAQERLPQQTQSWRRFRSAKLPWCTDKASHLHNRRELSVRKGENMNVACLVIVEIMTVFR
jgi:hypothetical protein